MDGCARPVRMPLNSSLATTTAFSIFSSASRRLSSITAAPLRCSRASRLGPAYQCADPLTTHGPDDITLTHQVKYDNRQVIVHAQADRGRVHYPQAAGEHLGVVELVEPRRVGAVPRVGVVDAVHLGALEHRGRADLQGALCGAGVGGEERGSEPGTEDDDTALLQVPDRPPRNVGLGD